MNIEVILNGVPISAYGYKQGMVQEKQTGNSLHTIAFSFQVKSEEYHSITTLLYENSFDVTVPAHDLTFHGTIRNYVTSFTNLYQENQVAEFSLELVEMA